MDAKEYLSQARRLNEKYRAKQDEITSIEALLLQAVSYGKESTMVNSSNNKNERIILKLMELQDQLNQQLLELMDKQEEIIRTINQVEDAYELAVLQKRYIQFKSWGLISVEMNYSDSQLFRIHSSALQSVNNILNHGSK